MINKEKMKLGKLQYKKDDRTLRLAKFILPDIRVPRVFDFDHGRTPFPVHMWGNDAYGDCVIAGEANHLLRLERVEQRRTIRISDQDAIARYQNLTGSRAPGDANDTGLEIVAAMRDWHHNGFMVGGTIYAGKNYSISAYGELDTLDFAQLRMASYVFHGIHFGFWLPRAAQSMTQHRVWDYQGQQGPEWEPGSWGGHLVYSKAFDQETFEVLTWGEKVKVTQNFIAKYADESWAVVDSLDSWLSKQTIDVTKLQTELSQISSKIDQ